MKKLTIILCLVLLFSVKPAECFSRDTNFEKGVVYLLLEDYQQSKLHFTEYFKKSPNPIIRRGFLLLVGNDKKNAKSEFRRFLNMNFRSLQAIVGISISVSDTKESTAKENLRKAVRLDSNFSSAYACLGMEYMKDLNYPMAEKYFLLASKVDNLLEYRLLRGQLYLKMGHPDKTVSLIETDAINNPDNFLLNYLMARSLYKLNRINSMEKYILISSELSRTNKNVQLLYANYLLKKNEPKKARSVLKVLRFKKPNPDYTMTYGKTLLALGERRAKNYLYEFFSSDNWDLDINRLLGLYYLKNKTDKNNIQNWIFRAILSGNSLQSVKKDFSADFYYPVLEYLTFFDLKKIFWVDNEKFFIVAEISSGLKEKLLLIDFRKKKIVASFNYNGIMNSIYISENREKIVLESINPSSKKTELYAITKNRSGSFQFRKIYIDRDDIPPFNVVFNSDGTEAYFVDRRIEELSFDSPFSKVTRFGEKQHVYSGLSNFSIYKYDFSNHRFRAVVDMDEINRINSKTIKKFLMVYNAAQITKEVRKLIQKGEKLDSFSSEVVRIEFSGNLDSFLIYLSDLKNAFQAVVFDNETGRVIKIDSSMFLETVRFAELKIINFDSEKKRIVFITKDKRRDLILFNYESKLYRNLAENFYNGCFNEDTEYFYILTERNRKFFSTETLLMILSLNPFWKEEHPSRRDLKSILDCEDITSLIVSTNSGEILEMGIEDKFKYVSPSYEEAIHNYSPDKKRVAVYINKKLFLINNISTWVNGKGSKK